jgi:sulfur carrier protein ThiS
MIKLRYREKEWQIEGECTVRQAIEKVGLKPRSVLAVRDGELITGDRQLQDGDEIRLLAVISGGCGTI